MTEKKLQKAGELKEEIMILEIVINNLSKSSSYLGRSIPEQIREKYSPLILSDCKKFLAGLKKDFESI